MTTATTTPKAKPARTAKSSATVATPEAKPAAEAPPVVAAVEAAEQSATAAVVDATKAIEQAVKVTQDAATQGYDKAVAVAKDQVEAAQKVQAQAVKSSEEALAAAKENVEAVVKAGQMLAQGLQDLSKSVVVLTQEAVEESVASTKKLLAAKTLHEAVDLHSAHAKAQIDRMMAESARLTEVSRKLFEDALAPIQDRVHSTVDKITKLTRR